MNNGTGKSNFTKLGGFGVLSIAVLGLGLIGCGSTAPVIQDSSVVEGSEKMTPVEHDSDSPRDDGQPRRHSGGVSGNNYQAGVSLLQDGKLEEARRVLELAGEEMPDRIEIRNALGALYRRLGRTEQAVSEYRKGLELAKDSPQTKESGEAASQLHNNLGIALREMGDFGGAEAEYQEAIRLNSRLPDPYYNIGVLYDLYMNKGVEAVKYYKAYLSLAGSNKNVELWIKDLEQNRNNPGGR